VAAVFVLALNLYWSFMKDHPIIGTVLTVYTWKYLIEGAIVMRTGRRINAPYTPPQEATPAALPVAPRPPAEPEPPRRIGRAMDALIRRREEQQDRPSRLDRLMRDDET
jgi:hypothetical protein